MEHLTKMTLVVFALLTSGAIVLGPLWLYGVYTTWGEAVWYTTARRRREQQANVAIVLYYCLLVLGIIYIITG